MPFGQAWSNNVHRAVEEACKLVDIECVRGDDTLGAGVIDDIWDTLVSSRAAIVDLTSVNPNVMYELGLAHALGKSVILLYQASEELPFDVRAFRHVRYSCDDAGLTKLKTDIQRPLREIFDVVENNFGRQIDPADRLVVFASAGGTCRCAMANVITRRLLLKRAANTQDLTGSISGVETMSVAVRDRSVPEMTSEAKKVLDQRLKIETPRHNTIAIDGRLLRRADLILAMDDQVLKAIGEPFQYKSRLFKEFMGNRGNVVDPWKQGEKAYEKCFGELHDLISRHLDRLTEAAPD